jgi:integrase
MLKRRGGWAGITGLHAHVLRHIWAHAFRAAGGNEGDLMLLGGWRSGAMLDRYGKAAAGCRWTTEPIWAAQVGCLSIQTG